jgi:thioredoxin-related protein
MVKIIYLLFILSTILTVASANDSFILTSVEEANQLSKETNRPALIIFGSDYCRFCESLKNDILSSKLTPHTDKYIVCYIDIKKNLEIKNQYNISTIPDSRIFINEKQKKKIIGYSKENYIKWLSND